MDDKELLELIASQIEEMTKKLGRIEEELLDIRTELEDSRNIYIEDKNNYHEKLSALYDGFSKSSGVIRRIESKLSNQEEVILRRL